MVQAAGSSAGLVLTRTIVHDVYGRERSGQVIAYITVVMIFVPMLSPLAGGILLDHVGWRAIFFLCAAIGLAALATLAMALPETNLTPSADLGLRSTLASFRRSSSRSSWRRSSRRRQRCLTSSSRCTAARRPNTASGSQWPACST
jgi:MFS family permease